MIVSKKFISPNCPELRSFKRFWDKVNKRLTDTSLAVQSDKEFLKKWTTSIKIVTKETLKDLMKDVQEKLKNNI